ncbi:CAP domain-containing protein [Paracoccus sp. p4-l81]|uniref:CAP domain-containing protein n=1 Tax=Paracoccus sp. p4-l81 TaxID=3342806 RepID=UPI0035BA61A3
MRTTTLLALPLIAALAACTTTRTVQPATSHGSSDYPDVQASAPGKATCVATTAADNAAAAATNAARARSGLAPVKANDRLAKAAAAHACDMAQRGLMAHQGSTTTGPSQRVKAQGYRPALTAENIAAGPFDRARVLAEWNGSQGHLSNIMIPSLREVGIGRAIGSDGRTVFWAAVYAQPR